MQFSLYISIISPIFYWNTKIFLYINVFSPFHKCQSISGFKHI